MANVLNALPKSAQPTARKMLAEIRDAEDRTHAEQAVRAFADEFGAKWPKAVAKITDDVEPRLAFFDFPAEHWVHLKTTNPIESTFSTVRLRTRVTKGPGLRAVGDGVQAHRGRSRPVAIGQRAEPRRPRARSCPLRARCARRVERGGRGVNVGWIWTVNLLPFLEMVSRDIGYAFDDSDWIAIEYGLNGTSSEAGPWFDYPLGELTANVTLEPGADEMVSIRLDGDTAQIEARIGWLTDVLRDYELRPRGR